MRDRDSLIRNARLSGLHPLQCRNTLPHSRENPLRRAEQARSVPCGMRLDRASRDSGSALAARDLAPLLALQQRILEYLSPQTQDRDRSAAPVGSYFSDLIATTHLIKLTWPLGAEFLPSSRLDGIVQAYVEPLIAQITAPSRDRGNRVNIRATKIAPVESLLCGVLLAAADAVLGNRELATLRPRVQPLAREAYRRASVYAGRICTSTDISPVLARAITRRIYGLAVRPELRTIASQHHFRVEEIPSFLPRAWFDQHFTELIRRIPHLDTAMERHLRRGATLRLAELKSGATWNHCALAVGMQPSLARRALRHLGSRLDTLGLWPVFEEAVEHIAEFLDANAQRVDYANRRRRLDSWRLPADDWLAMSEGIPGMKRITREANPTIGSALVWAEVTEGERIRSPVVLDLLQRGEDTQVLAVHMAQIGNGVGGSTLRLRRRLHLYAERLAVSCDENLELGVSVREVIRDEAAQTGLDVLSRVERLHRAVCELKDPVTQMAPDHLWKLFQSVVPAAPDRVGKTTCRRLGNREALAAIVFVSTSGCGWQSLPSGFGLSGQTAYKRFTEWSEAQVWTALRQRLSDATEEGYLDWSRRAIDAVSTRADTGRRRRR